MARRGQPEPGWWFLIGTGAVILLEAERQRREAERKARFEHRVRTLFKAVCQVADVEAPPLVLVQDPRFQNAKSDGFRIYVGVAWLRGLVAKLCKDPACANAVIAGILAHELGHHVFHDGLTPLNPFLNQIVQRHRRELRADYFAGAVLGRMRFNADDFGGALVEISKFCEGSHTHPCEDKRMPTMAKGYLDYYVVAVRIA